MATRVPPGTCRYSENIECQTGRLFKVEGGDLSRTSASPGSVVRAGAVVSDVRQF
jgi:hypothetical protein